MKVISEKFDEEQLYKSLPELKALPIAEQRALFFGNQIGRSCVYSSLYEDDDKLCLSSTVCTLRWNTKIYVTRLTTGGFSYDKKIKKLRFWFGSSIHKLKGSRLLKRFLHYTGNQWFLEIPEALQTGLTKTLLEQILSRKINNVYEYVQAYLKVSARDIKVNAFSYYEFFINKNTNHYVCQALNDILRVAVDPNIALRRLNNYTAYNLQILVGNVNVIGEKIDFSLDDDGIIEFAKKVKKEKDLFDKDRDSFMLNQMAKAMSKNVLSL